MRTPLRVVLVLFGVTDIAIALAHIVLGPAAIPGSVPVNATMDSEDRFYATLFLAYGAAVLWSAKVERAPVVYYLMLVFFAGGVARVVSMLAVGPPSAFFIAMTVVELVLPLVVASMQFRVARAQSAALADGLGSVGR